MSDPTTSPYAIAALRRHYEKAAADEAAGEKFYQLMASYDQRDPVVLGYKGAAEAIKARDASLLEKLRYVQAAAHTFEQAVALNPQNAEVRYLRFSVETNLPSFLGMSKHVEEDRQMLIASLLKHPSSGLDAAGFQTIRNYLLKHGKVSAEEAQKLNGVKS
ncbi:hypothetical protein [Hymenobacter cavernae]|uniref:Tetratricopeptide repeat protein n=1 Tax=Hymenobacter cavernae TaxID=2044852 RepID=A0ABQ1UK81_9BACT|nr:hypothetical protein [Hymenobacter cavernae]GGF18785.1 hypothetical protein GCM10011383_32860 [Hymenobacter cavernae]